MKKIIVIILFVLSVNDLSVSQNLENSVWIAYNGKKQFLLELDRAYIHNAFPASYGTQFFLKIPGAIRRDHNHL